MNSESAVDLSAVLLPVTGQLLVVPSALVAEIIKRRELQRPEGAPDWLLGHVKWHHEQVPVISFESMNEDAIVDPASGSRIVIFAALAEAEHLPVRHYALLTRGVPNLLRLTPEDVHRVDGLPLGPAERMKVRVYGQPGALPDFDYIERQLGRHVGATV
jgi:chemotaxis signal transduction protein